MGENVDFKFSASKQHSEGKHCQLETEAIHRPRICKEAATKYYNYTANEADEEREHQLPKLQQNAVNRICKETEERQAYSQNYLLRCNDRK